MFSSDLPELLWISIHHCQPCIYLLVQLEISIILKSKVLKTIPFAVLDFLNCEYFAAVKIYCDICKLIEQLIKKLTCLFMHQNRGVISSLLLVFSIVG